MIICFYQNKKSMSRSKIFSSKFSLSSQSWVFECGVENFSVHQHLFETTAFQLRVLYWRNYFLAKSIYWTSLIRCGSISTSIYLLFKSIPSWHVDLVHVLLSSVECYKGGQWVRDFFNEKMFNSWKWFPVNSLHLVQRFPNNFSPTSLKRSVHLRYHFPLEAKYLSAEPFYQVWKEGRVTGG